jgi:hypothetical protein
MRQIRLQTDTFYHSHTSLLIVGSENRDFAVFESVSSLFYQIFASQIIFEMRKTCRRRKGNLFPPVEESPQVFGIAR